MADLTANPKTPTAIHLGSGTHTSLLLHRAAAVGMPTGADLASEAVRRGCRYYAVPGISGPAPPGAAALSNEDLAICLLHPSLPHDPHRIRIGAAMLAAHGNDPRRLARRAVQERAERIVSAIAGAGLRYEPDNPFWSELLSFLPACAPVPEGVLPHHSRFVALAGRTSQRRSRSSLSQWIRPVNPAARH
jgi:hypothetical protein